MNSMYFNWCFAAKSSVCSKVMLRQVHDCRPSSGPVAATATEADLSKAQPAPSVTRLTVATARKDRTGFIGDVLFLPRCGPSPAWLLPVGEIPGRVSFVLRVH